MYIPVLEDPGENLRATLTSHLKFLSHFFKIGLNIATKNDCTTLVILLSSFLRCLVHNDLSPQIYIWLILENLIRVQLILEAHLVYITTYRYVSFFVVSKPSLSPSACSFKNTRHHAFPPFLFNLLNSHLCIYNLVIVPGFMLYSTFYVC